jgi:hypothetical protein
MRATLGLIALAFVCTAAAAADKYESKEGKFKVAFPKGAKVSTKQQDGGKGTKMNLVLAEQGDRAFVVMYMTLPDAVVNELSPKTLLDGGVKDWPKKGEKLGTVKELAFGPDRLPGRDFVVEKPGGKLRAWMVLAGPTLYVVAAGGKGEFATGQDAAAFLESFEITK